MRYLITLVFLCICVLSDFSCEPTVDIPLASKFLSMDSEYAELSIEQIIVLKRRASVRMIDDGWTANNYVLHEMDCEDFALRLKTEMTKIASELGLLKGKALAVGLFGYKKDTGGGHAIIFALCDNRFFFFEPYPEQNMPIVISDAEFKSAMIKIY